MPHHDHGQESEVSYMNRTIPHHQSAIEVASIIRGKAVHSELRAATQKTITMQADEIGQLTNWLQEWYGQQPSPDPAMQMSKEMLNQFRDAEPRMAEKMFLLTMREHHQQVIDMSEKLVSSNPPHTELQQFAQKAINVQRQEQQQLGEWASSWYGITPPAPTGDVTQGMRAAMGNPVTASDSSHQAPSTH